MKREFIFRFPGSLESSESPGCVLSVYNRSTVPQAPMTTKMKDSARVKKGFSLIPDEKLIALHAAMTACRRMAEGSSVRKDARGKFDSMVGLEAAVVGTGIDLGRGDAIAAAHWPEAMLRIINSSVSVVAEIPEALEASATKKTGGQVSAVYSSGAQTDWTAWRRALKSASNQKLPVVFVSLVRADATGPSRRRSAWLENTAELLPSLAVDGNDVVAVYRVASEGITHARKGHGPTLIECWIADGADPIENMAKYLAAKGLYGAH